MEDWRGLVTEPEANMRFRSLIRQFKDHQIVQVYEMPDWPPLTIGVEEGVLCMSSDVYRAMAPALVRTEQN